MHIYASTEIFSTIDDKVDCTNYPLFYKSLRDVGLSTPWEQYTLYGTVVTSVLASVKPLHKAYYLNKWLHETDDVLKIIWAGKGSLMESEMRAGKKYLTILLQTPRRWSLLPTTFIILEGFKWGYHRLFKAQAGK
jgi:hypothetical protein